MARKSYEMLYAEMLAARGRYEALIDHEQRLCEVQVFLRRSRELARVAADEAHLRWKAAYDKKKK